MRTFYKQILDRTYEIFGSRQTENMDEDQIVFLLNALENVSKMYAYIPEEQQKAIINKRMITDKEYKNINVRLIASWFEQDGKIFYREVSQLPNEPTAKPLEGDARDKAIEKYLESIGRIVVKLDANKPKGSGSRLRENLEGAGIIAHVLPSAQQSEPIENTFFCVMPKVCAQQCERCKAESEILNANSINQDNGI